ncbi:MAG: alpha/beta hydrolase [Weeksellaceae bacterium]|nr:alpha/beta hydrolase [Weeksellaceae bacterium]
MAVFIISNREISQVKSENSPRVMSKFCFESQTGTSNFRIAKFLGYKPPEKDGRSKKDYKKALKEKSDSAHEILSDYFECDYTPVKELLLELKRTTKVSQDKLNRLRGSQKMFFDFYRSMLETERGKRGDLLVFIHGYSYTFSDELEAMETLKKQYVDNPDSPVSNLLLLSWPGSKSVFPYTYIDDKRNSIDAGMVFYKMMLKYNEFLKQVLADPELSFCGQRIHLMAHSMGNRLLRSALICMKSSNIMKVIDQVLLLNSDISVDSFEKEDESMYKLTKLANRITVYINKSDDILSISTLSKNILSPRLGKYGPMNINSLPENVNVIDCTKAENDLGTGLQKFGDHWGYLSSTQVQRDIIETLKGEHEELIAHRFAHRKYDHYYELRSRTV